MPPTSHATNPLNDKSLDCLECFHIVWNVYRLSGLFPDNLECLQTVRELELGRFLNGQYGKFQYNLKIF